MDHLDSGSWQKVHTQNGPSRGVANAAYCTTDDSQLFIFAGFYGSPEDYVQYNLPQCTNDLWRLDLHSMQWHSFKKNNSWPCPRCGARAAAVSKGIVVHGGKIFHGGFSDKVELLHELLLDDLWLFNTRSQRWSSIQPKGPKPSMRCDHVLVAKNDCIFCWGGLNGDEKMWILDLNQETKFCWTALQEGESPRQNCVFGLIGSDTLLILGGTTSKFTEEKQYYDPKEQLHFNLQTHTWTILRHMVHYLVGQTEAAGVVYNDNLFVFGGYSDARMITDFSSDKDNGIIASGYTCESFYYNSLFRLVSAKQQDSHTSSIRYATPAGEILPKRSASAIASIDPQGNFLCWGGYSTLGPCETRFAKEKVYGEQRVTVFNTLWRYKFYQEPPLPFRTMNQLDITKIPRATTTDISKEKSLSIHGLKNACHLNGQYARLVKDCGDRVIMELFFPKRKVSVPRICVGHSGQINSQVEVERGVHQINQINYDSWLEACRHVIAHDLSKRQQFSKLWIENHREWLKDALRRGADSSCRAALVAKYNQLRPPRPHDQMHTSHFVWVEESNLDKHFMKAHEKVFTENNNKFWRDEIIDRENLKDIYAYCSFLILLVPYLHDPNDDDIPEHVLDLKKEKAAYSTLRLHAWSFTIAPGFGAVPHDQQIVQDSPEGGSRHEEVQRLLQIDDFEQVPHHFGSFRCCFYCRKISKTSLIQKGVQVGDMSEEQYSTVVCDALQACAKCKVTSYCSKQCQTADWARHKNSGECTNLRQRRKQREHVATTQGWGELLQHQEKGQEL